MYRFGFIIEQNLGHITHGQNLRRYVPLDPTVEACWGLPIWETSGWGARLPIYRSNWTVQAGLQARRALASIRRRGDPDALFFHTQVTAVLSPDWLRRFPSVVSLDATPRQYDELGDAYGHVPGPAWLERWKWRLIRDCFRRARRLITWSEWARQGLVDDYQVPPGKVVVLPPGVDTQAWACPAPRTPNGTVKILFVGGDLERKGGRLLLEAFRCLKESLSFAHYARFSSHAAGREGIRLELHLVTRSPVPAEAGVFVYNDLGPNSECLKRLFFESDIFCLPTQGDCLPMALSEAAAAGLPSVSTRLAAIPEIVHDCETGFLAPPGDLEALTAALQRLVADPELRRRQGQAAARLAREKFDAGSNAARLLDLLKQIASGQLEEELSV